MTSLSAMSLISSTHFLKSLDISLIVLGKFKIKECCHIALGSILNDRTGGWKLPQLYSFGKILLSNS